MLGTSKNVGKSKHVGNNLKMLGKFYIAPTWAVQFGEDCACSMSKLSCLNDRTTGPPRALKGHIGPYRALKGPSAISAHRAPMSP